MTTDDAQHSGELSPVKQALLEIRRLSQRVKALEQAPHAPVAVIGAGLRLPGQVKTLDQLWALLANGVHAIGEVPAARWNPDRPAGLELSPAARSAQRFGGFLEDIQGFDAHFFGISPREAETMDPQQRMLLEVTWEALENAGQAPGQLFGQPCGVFVGICGSDYYRMLLADPASIDHYTTTGNALSVAAGRISYLLGLHGPNLAIDTACSSSLAALHLAVNSLRAGECSLALVGGVNLMLSPEITQNFANANMLAPDGRCKTFDASANGYVRSEGCVVVTLKRLDDAQRDGDRILGVIRGTAINHDGRSGGLTAPNGPAQEAVITAALADACVERDSVGYIEAHGTGTSLGDPIEAGALVNVFCRDRSAERPLFLGSVKTNLGHLEAAAGLAGLLKALLALQHHRIPPHLHLERVSPYLHLEGTPIQIPKALTEWPQDAPLIAGVSSFGLSGTNAHVVVEAAPCLAQAQLVGQQTQPLGAGPQVLPLSARSQPALSELAKRWESFLSALPEKDFEAACRTAGNGRDHFDYRLALAAGTAAEARQALAQFASAGAAAGVHEGKRKPSAVPAIAFLFTGQGLNYTGMGRGLYETEPVFRSAVDECAGLFGRYLEKPLLAALFPDHYPDGDPALLGEMAYAQAGLFALQMGLARLWMSWGVQPAYLSGHSAGEYPAAVLAGVFSLEDAVRLVATRSRLLAGSKESAGRMATIFAEAAAVEAVIAPYQDRLAVAAYNGPKTVVISGEREALDEALASFKSQGIKWRVLEIAQAAHSPLIEPSLDAFEQAAQSVNFAPARAGFASTVRGKVIEPEEIACAGYWRDHLRRPVQFSQAMQAMYAQGVEVFIEIGPNPGLLVLGERCLPKDAPVAWLPSLRSGNSDRQVILDSLARVYARGAEICWGAVTPAAEPIEAPTYPFQHERYWAAPAEAAWKNVVAHAQPDGRLPHADDLWKKVAAAGNGQAARGPLDLAIERYPEIWDCLDRLSVAYTLKALKDLGLFCEGGAWLTAEEAARRATILPTYHHLLANLFGLLAEKGHLERRGEAFSAARPLPAPDIARAEAEAHNVLRGLPFVETYVRGCGAALSAALSGKINPLVTLFPGGSFDLAEALYGGWALARYFSELIGAVAAAYQQASTFRLVRVLEIGAGTGGTTQAVLPLLDAQRCVYTFTDVSDLFLSRAAEKFGAYPFVQYAILDIEKPIEEQGFSVHGYDVVVAANVLHATRDLRHTLENVKRLLAPGGILLATEATTYLSWFDITTALIAGWQRFDDGLRRNTPLLNAQQWLALLSEMGFEYAAAWPEAGSPAEALGQSVLAAMLATVSESAEAGRRPVVSHQVQAAVEPFKQAGEAPITEQLRLALADEREELLMEAVCAEIRRILRLQAGFALDGDSPLHTLGVDSLMSLELRRTLANRLDLAEDLLPSTLVFDYPTPKRLAGFLAGFFMEDESHPVDIGTSTPPREVSIETASDDEVAALLLAKLKKSKI